MPPPRMATESAAGSWRLLLLLFADAFMMMLVDWRVLLGRNDRVDDDGGRWKDDARGMMNSSRARRQDVSNMFICILLDICVMYVRGEERELYLHIVLLIH